MKFKIDRTSRVSLSPGGEDTTDDQHLSAVRALGGPAAARAALVTASERPNGRTEDTRKAQ